MVRAPKGPEMEMALARTGREMKFQMQKAEPQVPGPEAGLDGVVNPVLKMNAASPHVSTSGKFEELDAEQAPQWTML